MGFWQIAEVEEITLIGILSYPSNRVLYDLNLSVLLLELLQHE